MHSVLSSRSTTFLLTVVALVLMGRTAITTAESVRLLPQVSLGTDSKSHVNANCWAVSVFEVWQKRLLHLQLCLFLGLLVLLEERHLLGCL